MSHYETPYYTSPKKERKKNITSGNMRGFDGLQGSLGLSQSRLGLFQFSFGLHLVNRDFVDDLLRLVLDLLHLSLDLFERRMSCENWFTFIY